MTDQALRTAERRDAAEGTTESRVALLWERLRTGRTTRERLRLVAFLTGDEAAREVGGEDPTHMVSVKESVVVGCPYENVNLRGGGVEEWRRRLERRCDAQSALRVASSAIRWVTPRLDNCADHRGERLGEKCAPVLRAVDYLLLDWGNEGRRETVLKACEGLAEGATDEESWRSAGLDPKPDWWAIPSFVQHVGTHGMKNPPSQGWLAAVIRGCVMWPARGGSWSRGCPHRRGGLTVVPSPPCRACLPTHEEEVRRRIREEVVPWAEGGEDPVAERRCGA